MKKYLILALAAAAFGLAACKKKQPETIPQPKAEANSQAEAVSTGPVIEQNPLKMPANYIKAQVGNIEKAKAAKAVYEKASAEHMNALDLGGSGGN